MNRFECCTPVHLAPRRRARDARRWRPIAVSNKVRFVDPVDPESAQKYLTKEIVEARCLREPQIPAPE